MTDLKKITQSKYFIAALGALGSLIAGAVIFGAGIYVGEHRAKYSYQWGANYERNFVGGPGRMGDVRNPGGFGGVEDGRPMGMMGNFEGRDFRNGHGIAGTIVSISDNNIVVKDRSGKENTITVTDKTLIKTGQADIKITDLKADDNIVVIGNPGESGVVNADLIRVFNVK
jgi:hypothetical protein